MNGKLLQSGKILVTHIWVMNKAEPSTVSNFIMQTFLRKKLLIYNEVIQTLEQYKSIWQNDDSFKKAVERFQEVSRKENLDLYLADNILKYTIDFKMFSFRKDNIDFFQQYFRSRVLAKKELA